MLFGVLAAFAGAMDCNAGALVDGQAVSILSIAETCDLCVHDVNSLSLVLESCACRLASQVLEPLRRLLFVFLYIRIVAHMHR